MLEVTLPAMNISKTWEQRLGYRDVGQVLDSGREITHRHLGASSYGREYLLGDLTFISRINSYLQFSLFDSGEIQQNEPVIFRGKGAFYDVHKDGNLSLSYLNETDYIRGRAYGVIIGATATMSTIEKFVSGDRKTIQPQIFSAMLLLSYGICYRPEPFCSDDRYTAMQTGPNAICVPLEFGMQCLARASGRTAQSNHQ